MKELGFRTHVNILFLFFWSMSLGLELSRDGFSHWVLVILVFIFMFLYFISRDFYDLKAKLEISNNEIIDLENKISQLELELEFLRDYE